MAGSGPALQAPGGTWIAGSGLAMTDKEEVQPWPTSPVTSR
jgi:hypothetical protein